MTCICLFYQYIFSVMTLVVLSFLKMCIGFFGHLLYTYIYTYTYTELAHEEMLADKSIIYSVGWQTGDAEKSCCWSSSPKVVMLKTQERCWEFMFEGHMLQNSLLLPGGLLFCPSFQLIR